MIGGSPITIGEIVFYLALMAVGLVAYLAAVAIFIFEVVPS